MFWSDPPSAAQFLVSRKERQQRLFQAVCSRCQQLNQVDEMLSLGLKAKWPSLHFFIISRHRFERKGNQIPILLRHCLEQRVERQLPKSKNNRIVFKLMAPVFTSMDSSLKGLSNIFWVQLVRVKHSAAESGKRQSCQKMALTTDMFLPVHSKAFHPITLHSKAKW